MGPALIRRSRILLALAVVAVIAGTVVYVVRTTHQPTAVQVGGAAGGAFNGQGQLADNAKRALFSSDGSRLAVISSDGVGLAEQGTVTLLTPHNSNAVDAAWTPDSASLLVGEGPADVNQLALLNLDGTVKGVAHLDQPFSLGDGNGIAVSEDGTRAIVTSETRDAIGGRRHLALMLVALTTGHVTPLSTGANVDEAWPVFAAGRVLLAHREGAGRWQVQRLDLATNTRTPISPSDEDAFPVGALRTGPAVYASGRPGHAVSVWAVRDDGSHTRMGRLPAGSRAWTVEPGGTRAVVSEPASVGGQPLTVVREVTLKPPGSG